MSTSSIKRRIGRFHVVVVQWTSKKCTKKHDARAEVLFHCLKKDKSGLKKGIFSHSSRFLLFLIVEDCESVHF